MINRVSRSQLFLGDRQQLIGSFGKCAEGAAGEQAERAANRSQWGAQFVAHHGHELVPIRSTSRRCVMFEHDDGTARGRAGSGGRGPPDGQWGRRHFDRELPAIGPDVGVLLRDRREAVPYRLGDVALAFRSRGAIGVPSVERVVRAATDQFGRREPQHSGRRRIDKGDPSSRVDAVDAVTDRLQQQLAPFGQPAQISRAFCDSSLQPLA